VSQDLSSVVVGVEKPYELQDEDVRAVLEVSVQLHESSADLERFPFVVFDLIKRLIGADVVGYGEIDPVAGTARGLHSEYSAEKLGGMRAYADLMKSHPFWQADPKFFGQRVLKSSDFFSQRQYRETPIGRELMVPNGVYCNISFTFNSHGRTIAFSAYCIERRDFDEKQRAKLEALRPIVQAAYEQARLRTLLALSPLRRLMLAFPSLTLRQAEVAAWLAEGKSNEVIGLLLGIGPETVKSHLKAIFAKLGVEDRFAAGMLAWSVIPDHIPPSAARRLF
jgi:DNA-binding CsgD family transcriptional regulator